MSSLFVSFYCSTVINRLWNDPANKDVVDAFMNNKLCVEAAQGKPEAIEAYKKYVVVSSTSAIQTRP